VGSGTYQPSFELGGCKHEWDYYFTGQFLQDERGVEPPTKGSQAHHDFTQQGQGFAYVSRLLGGTTRLTLMRGLSVGDSEIPTDPGLILQYQLEGISYYPPSAIWESQLDRTFYGILALQGSLTDATNYQIAVFSRYFQSNFNPDRIGDLIYRGVASRVANGSYANGGQGDVSYRFNATHTLRSGFYFNEEAVASNTDSAVFLVDSDGAQRSLLPESVVDNSDRLTFLWRILSAGRMASDRKTGS
jgi:hypothetical protein